MEMKKGKANVPPQMRGQYNKQREMNAMQQQMQAASKVGEDGFPVFNLFVRTTTQKVRLVQISCWVERLRLPSMEHINNTADDFICPKFSAVYTFDNIANFMFNFGCFSSNMICVKPLTLTLLLENYSSKCNQTYVMTHKKFSGATPIDLVSVRELQG